MLNLRLAEKSSNSVASKTCSEPAEEQTWQGASQVNAARSI
jgi:hypothetical protein